MSIDTIYQMIIFRFDCDLWFLETAECDCFLMCIIYIHLRFIHVTDIYSARIKKKKKKTMESFGFIVFPSSVDIQWSSVLRVVSLLCCSGQTKL